MNGCPVASVSGGSGGAGPVTPSSVLIVAASANVRVGDIIQLSLIEVYSDGSQVDRTGAATWATTDAGIATVAAGLVTAVSDGSVTITGTYGAFSDTMSVTVVAASLITLEAVVSPAKAFNVSGTTWGGPFPFDDADDSAALIVSAPKAGQITKVGIYISGITGNPPAYNMGLFTVDSATGNPTTTNYGGSSTDTQDFTAVQWYWKTLTTPATVVNIGDLIAIVVKPTGTPPDGSNFAATRSGGWRGSEGPPRSMQFNTAWAAITAASLMALEYSDGTVVGFPMVDSTGGIVSGALLFGPATTPDEIGNVFQVPADVDCVGFWLNLAATPANGQYTIKLYDAANTLLASYVCSDEDELGGSGVEIFKYWAAGPIRLTRNVNYRLTVLAVTGTANYQLYRYIVESSNSRNALPEGSRWQRTSRTDAGAWTQTATEIASLGILIRGIYPPA